MKGNLIDGKAIARTIEEKTAERVSFLKKNGVNPKLAVVLVGEDKPSQLYVERKGKKAEKVGMAFELIRLPGDISPEDLFDRLENIQHQEPLSGLILQLPLPDHLNAAQMINVIHPEIDVDCLTDRNLGKLLMKTHHIVPPTPGAVLTILRALDVSLPGKIVTIIGAGVLVGKPLAVMMMNERATVSVCNSATPDIAQRCLQSDIIVTGVGKPGIVTGSMIKEGAIVIDAGVSFVDGTMVGDVDVDTVRSRAAAVTPTPGGVGPLTVAGLLWNTVICAELLRATGSEPHKQPREKYSLLESDHSSPSKP